MNLKSNEEIDLVISRFLSGDADNEEETTLLKWIGSEEDNRKYFNQVKNIWEVSDRRFNPESINPENALEKVLSRVSGENKVKKMWVIWKKIAAVLIIPLLAINLLWLFFGPKDQPGKSESVYNEVFATFGTRTSLKLADGSLVWLNSGSSLRYPDKFKGDKRVVYLNGEGYFEVASDPSFPFIVQTSSLNVRATGTKFNVSDYSTDINCDVALLSGKVLVSKIAEKGRIGLTTELNPNQYYELSKKSGESNVTDEDISEYISWKDGKLIFRNRPLSYVVKRISKIFNVDIELHGNVLMDYRYRATFEDESLTEILKLLKASSPVDYIEIKRDVLPDGTYTRKKVLIFPVREEPDLIK